MIESFASRSPAKTSGLSRALLLFLLLCLFGQLVFSIRNKSPTIDEPNHLTRGYAYLATGDLRLSRAEGHPPLFNLLCALPPFLLEDLTLPLDRPSWASGFRNAFVTEFIFGGKVPLGRVFFLGRFPVILATLCLAALACRWAGELYGAWGSVLALALLAFDPNLLAHGRLVTTDLGMTLVSFLTIYLFWRWLSKPSAIWLVASGVALGLAQGTKFSAVLLLPILGLLGLIEVVRTRGRLLDRIVIRPGGSQRREERRDWVRWLVSLVALGGVMVFLVLLALLVVWAIYGFQIGRPTGWSVTLPAPDYIEGLRGTFAHASQAGHPTFLMGRHSVKGWWYYFPVAFVLKTPLAALALLLGAGLSNAWKRFSMPELPLLLVPVIYLAFSMSSALNIGYRHLLPMLPFLWVYAGRIGAVLEGQPNIRKRLWAVIAVGALGLWLVVGTLGIAPDYLAYFNEFAGGPDGGWRYLVDSNLDWGQDLAALAGYAERHQISGIYLSWFGSTYPHLYDLNLDYRLLPSHFSYPYPTDAAQSPYNPLYPAPGVYAISATNLQGVGLAAGDVFARFREMEPVDRVGHSILIYHVSDPADTSEDALSAPTCISRLRFKDLTPETTALSLGRGPGPVKWFDHQTSFILPTTLDPVYVLPDAPLAFMPGWQATFLSRAELIHRQGEGEDNHPAAVVYALDRQAADAWLGEVLASLSNAPLGWSTATTFDQAAEVRSLHAPAEFEHGLQLVGYKLISGQAVKPGQAVELVTVWRVTAEMPPSASDLRVFVHLLDRQSQVWASEDRLDLYPPTWNPGDILIQVHHLPLLGNVAPGTYQLELGLYTATRMQRLSIYDGGRPVADRLLLQPVDVIHP